MYESRFVLLHPLFNGAGKGGEGREMLELKTIFFLCSSDPMYITCAIHDTKMTDWEGFPFRRKEKSKNCLTADWRTQKPRRRWIFAILFFPTTPQPYSFLYNGPPLLRSLAAACSGVMSLWGSANSSYLKKIQVKTAFFRKKAKKLCSQQAKQAKQAKQASS